MTYRDAVVAVVVPAYDEAAFVGDVIDGVPEFVDRIYPVDDCSSDDTWDVIRAAAERTNERRTPTAPYDRVAVPIRHGENRGAGGAVLTGYRRALDDGADVVATMDGDGQMDPRFLPSLLDPVVAGDVDYAKGDRLASPDDVREMSLWRLFGNGLLTGLTRVASGYWRLRDPQNGYTVASADVLAGLDFDALYERYGFRNDVLVHLNVQGARIADVSHPANYGEESSGISYPSFVPGLSWLLFRRFWWRLGRQASRRGDHGALTAFAGGAVGLVASAAGLLGAVGSSLSGAGSSSGPSRRVESAVDGEPPGRGRTDGGVAARADDDAPVPSLAIALFLICLGTLLDHQAERGRVVRLEGRPDDE
jgi:glycosyltransferase involved in cell wall biosynthesis